MEGSDGTIHALVLHIIFRPNTIYFELELKCYANNEYVKKKQSEEKGLKCKIDVVKSLMVEQMKF